TDGNTFTPTGSVGAGVTSYKSTGLSSGTKYFYEVRATNAAGNSAFSNIANATTSAVQASPAAPSNLSATAVSSSQINLTWTNNASNATGISIQRSGDGINFTVIATVASSVRSYADTGLTAGTKYYYRVQAANAVGFSAFSKVVTAVTASPINLAITTAAVTGGVSVNLNGSFADPDNSASDLHQVVINWGDGSAPTKLSLAGG